MAAERAPSDPAHGAADPYTPTSVVQAAARGAAGLRGAPTPSEVIAGLRATSHGEDLVQVLSPEGVFTPHEDFPVEVTGDLLRGLYRDMVLVRRFDREGNALQRQGQLNIWVPLLGQEAAQVGAGRAMRPADMAFPSYREHGVAWCRGIDPTELLGIFRGTDQCGWNPKDTRFNSYTIVIGNQVLNATGYAMGQKLDGVIGSRGEDGGGTAPDGQASTDEATIVFFGDGATSQGDVHEGMVFAAAFDTPIVFYCQNNQWAISEPVSRQSRVPLWERSTGYGFPGVRVDGNDVIACLAVTRWALDECRSGNGPVMIEAFTYRMDAHTTSDDPTRYRMAAEEEHWKLLDPIERVRAHLAREGLADQSFFDNVTDEADALAERFRTFCVQMPKPAPDRMFAHVYSEPHAGLEQQEREHAEYLAGFADVGTVVTEAGRAR
jgi:pyruvate dehydrogenase E1 component alpha subunit